MFCPIDNSPLYHDDNLYITKYICNTCQGIAISNTALGSYITKISERPDIPPLPAHYERKKVINPRHHHEPARTCPHCLSSMLLINYRYDSNIFLNKCPSCQYLWIDGDEIITLASLVKGNPHMRELGKLIAEVEAEKEAERTKTAVSPFIATRPILLGDTQPCETTPWVTLTIIFSCTVIFFIELLIIGSYPNFFQTFGFIPAIFNPLTLLSAMFIHGGIYHLLGNMFYLWVFGDNVEDKLGKKLYFCLYLFYGIFASVFAAWTASDPAIPHIGASGAISGILGSYYVLFPKAKVKVYWATNISHFDARLYIGFWFSLQILNSLINPNAGVAWTTHIAGFLLGVVIAYQWKKLHM